MNVERLIRLATVLGHTGAEFKARPEGERAWRATIVSQSGLLETSTGSTVAEAAVNIEHSLEKMTKQRQSEAEATAKSFADALAGLPSESQVKP